MSQGRSTRAHPSPLVPGLLNAPQRPFIGYGRGRTPSPSSSSVGQNFFPPTAPPSPSSHEPVNMGDEEPQTFTAADVQRIAAEAVTAALAQFQRPAPCQVRKPDLPPFDRKNVEVWIQRVEAAYARNNVITPSPPKLVVCLLRSWLSLRKS